MKNDRCTDIFEAAERNDFTAVKHFVETEKVPANSTNERAETAAHVGAKNGNLEIVRYLVDADASLLALKDVYGNSCLHLAVENGTLPLIIHLLRDRKMNMVEPNTLNFGCTPFHIAAEKGHLRVLDYLVRTLKGDVNVRNRLGESPLFAAVEQQRLDIVKHLAENLDANLTVVDQDGQNVLFVSAKLGELAILKYLTKSKEGPFDLNRRNRYGMTVACLAAKYDNDDFVTYVVGRKHADLNIADDEGRTPLHEAAINGNYHMVRYLCRHGANVHAADKHGKVPIHYAAGGPARIYLENAARRLYRPQPRLARSVVRNSAVKSATLSPAEYSRGITSERGSPMRDRNEVFSANDFLTLATICFRYHNTMYASLLSLQSTTSNRIDPFAIDSISTTYDSED